MTFKVHSCKCTGRGDPSGCVLGLHFGFGLAMVTSALEPEEAGELGDVGRREVPEDDGVRADVLAGITEERFEVVRAVVSRLKVASGSVSVSSGRRRFKAIQVVDRVPLRGMPMRFTRAKFLQDLSPSFTKPMRISSGACSAITREQLAVNENSLGPSQSNTYMISCALPNQLL